MRVASTAFEAHEGIAITNAQGIILRVNKAFTEITGYQSSDAVGSSNVLLRSTRQTNEFYDNLWATIERTGAWQGEIWNCRKTVKAILNGSPSLLSGERWKGHALRGHLLRPHCTKRRGRQDQ
ncbi:MAG: PAS domain-containing protein [Anaerolineales bacterium]|nr:PAS domain-containing protein [Anaerolineales bacterium]